MAKKMSDFNVAVGLDVSGIKVGATKDTIQDILNRVKGLTVAVAPILDESRIASFKGKIDELCADRVIDIKFNGNFDHVVESYTERINEMQKKLQDSSSRRVVRGPSNVKSVNKIKTDTSVIKESATLYQGIEKIVAAINSMKSEGIKLDQQATQVAASSNNEEKKKLATLNKVRSLYIAAYKEQQRYAGDKASEAYKNADANVLKISEEWQNKLNALTEEERVERQHILDIEFEQIKARQDNIRLLAQEKAQRKAETDYTKNIAAAERMNKTIQNMNSNMDLMRSRLNDPAKDINFIEYKQAADQFSAVYARLQTVKSTDSNGNFIDISDDLKDLEELRTKAEKVYGTIKESVSNTANVAKDADKLNQIYSDITSYMNKYGAELKKNTELYQRFITLQNKMANGAIGYFDAKKQFADIRMEAKRLGVEVDSLWKKMQRAFQARGRGLLSNEGWMLISMSMRDVVRNVIDLDTAMTELKKVTSATAAEYDRFLENAAVRAKDVGASLVDTVNATADFSRLGFDIPEASNLADSALVYLNVGDDVDDISQASETIVSTMQGFNIEAEKSMEIVDKYNEVANNYASSAGDIGEITKRSAAAMKVAGSDINETIALGVTANEVIQDSASVGEMCA